MTFLFSILLTMSLNNSLQQFNFTSLNTDQLVIVNDSVMGGLSRSQYSFKNDYIRFSGNVSLKNNGGFASLRMLWPFNESKVSDKLTLRVKGDGSTYQFRLRTNKGFDGAAYVYEFKTINDEWLDVEMKTDEFVPSFRGRVLKNSPPLEIKDVQQMGLLIAGKQTGEFSIDLESIILTQ